MNLDSLFSLLTEAAKEMDFGEFSVLKISFTTLAQMDIQLTLYLAKNVE